MHTCLIIGSQFVNLFLNGGVEKNLNVKLCSYLMFAFVSTSPSQEVNQWRIQDFPEEGAPTSGGGANI